MVSQFISNHKVRLLGEIDFDFPEGTHAIGRLDNHSEGLLILTTNKKITDLLFNSKTLHQRTYQVLVLRKVSAATVEHLQNGISFLAAGNKMYTTTPCKVAIIDEPSFVFDSPYTMNKYLDYTWLEITLTEGKYHQVRKMVATVGHKCVRLIRVSIENLLLDNLAAGGIREIEETTFFRALKL
jgi:23S rRNA pseudouridine2457 synthase